MNKELKVVLEKVLQLFYKYGIRAVSMDEVSSELGISKKTLYQQFGDKNNLVEQVENYLHVSRLEEYKKIDKTYNTALEEMMVLVGFMQKIINDYSRMFERDLKKYYPDIYLQRIKKKKEIIKSAIIKNLTNGVQEGIYRKEINVNRLSEYFLSYVLFMTEYDDQGEVNIYNDEYFEEIFMLHTYGVLNKHGIKHFQKILENKNNNK